MCHRTRRGRVHPTVRTLSDTFIFRTGKALVRSVPAALRKMQANLSISAIKER